MAATLIEEGKYKIQSVGPVKSGVAKASGKPWKTYSLQFDGDGTWYDTYWSKDTDPQVGDELEGRKENDDQFGPKFSIKFGNAKQSWNPAGANATVMTAAVAIVNGFLSLKPEHLKEWESKRKEKQSAIEHYIETVKAIAGQMKTEVVKMGGNETQVGEKTSSAPTADGDPGPVAPPADEGTEEDIDLGPL